MVHLVSALRPVVQQPVHNPKASRLSTTDGPGTSGTSGSSNNPGTSTAGSSDTGASDFLSLFATGTNLPSPAAPAPTPAAPTAQSVFGANPWMTSPTGVAPNGTTFNYNPVYFATAQTAATVAQMVGGTVVQSPQLGGGFQQQQTQYMVQLPNGHLINPGLIADYYTMGYSQSQLSQIIANEVQNT